MIKVPKPVFSQQMQLQINIKKEFRASEEKYIVKKLETYLAEKNMLNKTIRPKMIIACAASTGLYNNWATETTHTKDWSKIFVRRILQELVSQTKAKNIEIHNVSVVRCSMQLNSDIGVVTFNIS